MRSRRYSLSFPTVVVLIAVATACGSTGTSQTTAVRTTTASSAATTIATPASPTATPSTIPSKTTIASGPTADSLEKLVSEGSLEADVVSPDGGIFGEIFEVLLTNRSDEDIDVVIPCGSVFASAPGVAEQRMMVIQPVAATIPAGESTTVHPFVTCIDSDEEAASAGSAYSPAGTADKSLLAFADCLCSRDLATETNQQMGGMDLQFAVWAVADGSLPVWNGDPDDLGGALGAMTGESLDLDPEDLKELEGAGLDQIIAAFQAFMTQFGEGAQQWLDKCEIDLND